VAGKLSESLSSSFLLPSFLLTFAHRFFAAFAIAALSATYRTRFFAPFTSTATKAEWTMVVQALNKMVAPLPRSSRQGII
jgi:hypothetical protein